MTAFIGSGPFECSFRMESSFRPNARRNAPRVYSTQKLSEIFPFEGVGGGVPGLYDVSDSISHLHPLILPLLGFSAFPQFCFFEGEQFYARDDFFELIPMTD